MRYRVRPALNFWRVADGVQMQTWGGEFVIRGPQSLYLLCERLMARLDGGATREEALADIPPGCRDAALHVLDELVRRDAVMDTDALSSPDLAPDLRRAFGNAVGYLESVSDEPYAAFRALREATVLAIGRGESLFAAVRSLTDTGIGHLDCHPCGDPDGAERLREYLAGRRHLQGTVRPVDSLEEGLGCNARWSLAAYVRDGIDAEELARFDHAVSSVAEAGIAGVASGRAGIVVPPGDPGEPRLGSAVALLARQGSELVGANPGLPTPVLAAMTGNVVGMHAFRHLTHTRTPPDADAYAIVIEGETLDSSMHPLAAVRERCVTEESELHARIEAFRRTAAPRSADAYLDAFPTLTDPVFGIVTEPHPGTLPQIPLSLSSCAAVLNAAGSAGPVIGVGATDAEARHAALVDALREVTRRGDGGERVRVVDLDDHETHDVEPGSLVVAAGRSFADWLADGLELVLLRRMFCGPNVRRTNVRCDAVRDPDGQTYWQSLTSRFGRFQSLVHANVAGLPGAHGAAVVEHDEILAVGAGVTADKAVASALRMALARAQVEEAGARVARLPHLTIEGGNEAVPCGSPIPLPSRSRKEWVDAVLAALRDLGQRVIVRPWGGDAVLSQHLLLGWIGVRGA